MDGSPLRAPSITERRCDGAHVVTAIDTLTPEKRASIRRYAASLGFTLPPPSWYPLPRAVTCGRPLSAPCS